MGKPAPRFPATVATDQDLAIATNRISTSLSAPMTAGGTTASLASLAGIAQYNLLTIDSEVVQVTSSVIANPLTVTRSFDGTTAAAHAQGAKVIGFVDAWHHNALVSEVESIEQFLSGQNGAGLSSSAYDFAAITPGGSLIIGNNAIVLPLVPAGVNGTDATHYLYISGGTGTAEAVLITGGTGVAGQSNGQIIVNCAHTHTGAWTIRSATAGIQEAIQALPTEGGAVRIPSGQHTTYGSVIVSRDFVTLVGEGNSSTIITSTNPIVIIDVNATAGQANTVCDLQVQGSGTDIGQIGIRFRSQSFSRMSNVVIGYASIGLVVDGTGTFFNRFDDVSIPKFFTDGIQINTGPSGSGKFNQIIIGGDDVGVNGINFLSCVGAVFSNSEIQKTVNGIIMSPPALGVVAYVDLINVLIDASGNSGIVLNANAGTTIKGIRMLQTSSGNTQNASFAGLIITGAGTIDGVWLTDHSASFNRNTGIAISSGVHIFLTNCVVSGNGLSAPGTLPGMSISGTASRVHVLGGVYGPSADFPDSQNYGIVLNAGLDHITIENADVSGNLTATMAVGAITNSVIRNNIGYNPTGPASVSVTASPFTWTNGPSPAMVHVFGNTVTNIKRGSTTVGAAAPWSGFVPANGTLVVTYPGAAPTIIQDSQ